MAGLRQRLANLFLDLAKMQGGGGGQRAAAAAGQGRRGQHDGSGGVTEAVQTV